MYNDADRVAKLSIGQLGGLSFLHVDEVKEAFNIMSQNVSDQRMMPIVDYFGNMYASGDS